VLQRRQGRTTQVDQLGPDKSDQGEKDPRATRKHGPPATRHGERDQREDQRSGPDVRHRLWQVGPDEEGRQSVRIHGTERPRRDRGDQADRVEMGRRVLAASLDQPGPIEAEEWQQLKHGQPDAGDQAAPDSEQQGRRPPPSSPVLGQYPYQGVAAHGQEAVPGHGGESAQ
jgi:hypothetical protein